MLARGARHLTLRQPGQGWWLNLLDPTGSGNGVVPQLLGTKVGALVNRARVMPFRRKVLTLGSRPRDHEYRARRVADQFFGHASDDQVC